jgi:hypothetical protein
MQSEKKTMHEQAADLLQTSQQWKGVEVTCCFSELRGHVSRFM